MRTHCPLSLLMILECVFSSAHIQQLTGQQALGVLQGLTNKELPKPMCRPVPLGQLGCSKDTHSQAPPEADRVRISRGRSKTLDVHLIRKTKLIMSSLGPTQVRASLLHVADVYPQLVSSTKGTSGLEDYRLPGRASGTAGSKRSSNVLRAGGPPLPAVLSSAPRLSLGHNLRHQQL